MIYTINIITIKQTFNKDIENFYESQKQHRQVGFFSIIEKKLICIGFDPGSLDHYVAIYYSGFGDLIFNQIAVDTIRHEHLLHDGKGDTRIDISEKKHTFRGHRLRGIKFFFIFRAFME